MSKKIVLSYGGGRQTVAMCCAVKVGLIPRPDYIVMADTGREVAATHQYRDEVMTPYLSEFGLKVDVIGHDWSYQDLYADNGDLLIPAFTATGKLPTFCSSKWKRDVVRRWLRCQGVEECIMWLGFSRDEMKRMHMSGKQWVEHQFPLIDPLGWTVWQCEEFIQKQGLPPPPKSACWCCPHWKKSQWREMKENYPEDFEKAVKLDEEIRQKDELHDVYLYSGRVPLGMADLSKSEYEQPNLFVACESGHCFT